MQPQLPRQPARLGRAWSVRACTAALLVLGVCLTLSAHFGLRYSRKKGGGASTRLKPHTVSPRLAVPPSIPRPPYVDTGENPWSDDPQIHDAEVRASLLPTVKCSLHARVPCAESARHACMQGIQKMRAACRLAADVLEHAGSLVKVCGLLSMPCSMSSVQPAALSLPTALSSNGPQKGFA
jgi:hypothetical protein